MIGDSKKRPRKYKLTPRERPKDYEIDWLIQDLFPRNEVHLIGGPSGAGKTSLLFQMINELKDNKPIFGAHPAKNLPFIYAACDRSCANLFGTQLRLRADFPVISIPELVPSDDLSGTLYRNLIPELLEDNPQAQILFIDGLATTLPDKVSVNEYNGVAKMLTFLLKVCQSQNVTIFGVVHSTKCKEDEQFKYDREKILGSVAWAAFSETIGIVESAGNSLTQLKIYPRNRPSKEFIYEYDKEGKLILSVNEKEAGHRFLFLTHLGENAGKRLNRSDIVEICKKMGVLASTSITRLIDFAKKESALVKVSHDLYEVPLARGGPGHMPKPIESIN